MSYEKGHSGRLFRSTVGFLIEYRAPLLLTFATTLSLVGVCLRRLVVLLLFPLQELYRLTGDWLRFFAHPFIRYSRRLFFGRFGCSCLIVVPCFAFATDRGPIYVPICLAASVSGCCAPTHAPEGIRWRGGCYAAKRNNDIVRQPS